MRHGQHFKQRVLERRIPPVVLSAFDDSNVAVWDLVVGEIRTDTGKFTNSTWTRLFGADVYWVTNGLSNTAETVVPKDKHDSYSYITGGPLYEKVEAVNRDLMADA